MLQNRRTEFRNHAKTKFVWSVFREFDIACQSKLSEIFPAEESQQIQTRNEGNERRSLFGERSWATYTHNVLLIFVCYFHMDFDWLDIYKNTLK